MSRLNIILALLLLGSSLWLVQTSSQARRLFAELDRARATQAKLDAEYRRLDAERQAQATHGRVERVARERLAMRPATPGMTVYVSDSAASAVAASGVAR